MIAHLLKEGHKQNSRPTSHEVVSLETLLSKPKVVLDKSLIMHWNISIWTQPTEIPNDLSLTPRKIHNLGLNTTKYLVLDYDKDINLQNILEKFRKYRFWFHTSYNHTTETPKFRVILELDKEISNDEFKLIRDPEFYPLFSHYFGNVDLSCFSTKRFFAIPALKPGFENLYEWKIQEGELFKYDELRYYFNIIRQTMQKKYEKMIKTEQKPSSVEKKLAQLEKNIRKFDINNRGKSRGTNAKIYGYVKVAEKITGSLAEALVFVGNIAKPNPHPDTAECLRNISR